jgi:hypothetical protein
MLSPVILHVTTNLRARLRQMGLHVVEHANAITASCPGCTERQDYWPAPEGWHGAAFLHDIGCPHFRATRQRVGMEAYTDIDWG